MSNDGDQMGNNPLAKLMSTEMLILLVASGIAWGTLVSSVSALADKGTVHAVKHQKDVDDLSEDQTVNTKSLQVVTGKIILIENNLQHLKDAQDRQIADNKEILKILRQQ